jgi:hypothetical protein
MKLFVFTLMTLIELPFMLLGFVLGAVWTGIRTGINIYRVIGKLTS